ncbi:MAG: Na+/H+ antiporter NhaC [Deltaproteobacteria bacterium RIFOXYA12_FULL_58_15]|nr:MAG: Na+/H+ antiporter NhaC [Deltaproteobacteria bacterium RIFOXYA12_FULL_58_15]OGR09038.1 MAG: Na+/H+ antiporter NhaC [Deltaproteobacteria bacterium RIFOXYB12_FULL_58_9]
MTDDVQQSPADLPQPPLWVALVPIACLTGMLALATLKLEQPPHIPLILATAIAGLLGRRYGVTWERLLDGMTHAIHAALPACMILMVIGSLIGTWILGGIVPTLIIFGLKIVSPNLFLATSCLVCVIVSTATGSSWSTAGTVGVALIGIGATLHISPGLTAGAIISGAYVGDKMSPLSDTTNLAPAVAGTDLFTHVRHMVSTTLPSLVIALVAYGIIGFTYKTDNVSAIGTEQIVATIERTFVIHWGLLLPPLCVIALVVLRVPALPSLLVGAILGGICASLVQSASLTAVVGAAQGGYAAKTGLAALDDLLNRGGLERMMPTVALIVCALSFGGILETTGMLNRIATAILSGVHSTGGLVVRTLLTCIGVNILAGDQYMAIVIPGRMYKPAFAKRGLHPKNLSRCLEDAGTMTSPLVPWNTCGAFMATTLGVSPLLYIPFAFVNLLNPMTSALYGFTGWTMHPAEAPGKPDSVSISQ